MMTLAEKVASELPDLYITRKRDIGYITAHTPKGEEFLQLDYIKPMADGTWQVEFKHAAYWAEQIRKAFNLRIDIS